MNKKTTIIGIAGASGSGKTEFADLIAKELSPEKVLVIAADDYYVAMDHLTLEERKQANFDHPDSIDFPLLNKQLKKLAQQKKVQAPIFDFPDFNRKKETQEIGGEKIIILEGILLFYDEALRHQIDIKIFMDTPLEISLARLLPRDLSTRGRGGLESILNHYESTVRPMYFEHIEPTRRYADIIVPHGGQNPVALNMVTTLLKNPL